MVERLPVTVLHTPDSGNHVNSVIPKKVDSVPLFVYQWSSIRLGGHAHGIVIKTVH